MSNRRDALKQGAVLAGLLTAAGYPQYALAFNKNAFEAKTVQELMDGIDAVENDLIDQSNAAYKEVEAWAEGYVKLVGDGKSNKE